MASTTMLRFAYGVVAWCFGYLLYAVVVHHRVGWETVAAAVTSSAAAGSVRWFRLHHLHD